MSETSRPAAAALLAALTLGAAGCASAAQAPPAEGREYAADCWDTLPCEGTLSVHSAELVDDCHYGPSPWAESGVSAGQAGDGETYLEITATFEAHATENPDGVLLDQLAYIDPDTGEEVTAPLALACHEATNGDVFWTKNVQPGQTAQIYQPWVVPAGTNEVVIEGERVSVQTQDP